MQALQFHPGREDFIFEKNVVKPTIENEYDVLVQVEFAGLCGTDVHIVQVSSTTTLCTQSSNFSLNFLINEVLDAIQIVDIECVMFYRKSANSTVN